MLKLASEGLLAYGMIWSCDLGAKPSLFGNAWLRQPIKHQDRNRPFPYIVVLLRSKIATGYHSELHIRKLSQHPDNI